MMMMMMMMSIKSIDIYVYIRGVFNKVSRLFVQAFKIVVDS